MPQVNSVVAIYDTHSQAEEAVKDLHRSGYDMKTLSIVGKEPRRVREESQPT